MDINIPRDLLMGALNGDVRVVRFFEDQARVVSETEAITTSQLAETGALSEASVVTLSANQSFANERILAAGRGIDLVIDDKNVIIRTGDSVPQVSGGFRLTLTVSGDTNIAIPLTGILATRDNVETLTKKTLSAPKVSGISNYADDTAAAAGGVPIGGMYRTASALKVRVA